MWSTSLNMNELGIPQDTIINSWRVSMWERCWLALGGITRPIIFCFQVSPSVPSTGILIKWLPVAAGNRGDLAGRYLCIGSDRQRQIKIQDPKTATASHTIITEQKKHALVVTIGALLRGGTVAVLSDTHLGCVSAAEHTHTLCGRCLIWHVPNASFVCTTAY